MNATKTKCGRCNTHHANLAELQNCLNLPLPKPSTRPQDMSSEEPATEKQKDYVTSLLAQAGKTEKDLPKPLDELGKWEISPLIDQLKEDAKNAPRKTTGSPSPLAVAEGMYRNPETEKIYKVQRAIHGSGNLYAKQLRVVRDAERDDEGDIIQPGKVVFDYAPGVLRLIQPEWRMTMEQAIAFGALYGTCVRCGRTLTKEKSIERAMGPVCAGKL